MYFPSYRTFAVGALALLTGAACGPVPTAPVTEPVSLRPGDGVILAATLYRPPAQRPPGLILVHRYGADRHSWDAVASRLREAGYMALAIDLRGHGERTRRQASGQSYRSFTTGDWLGALADLRAAKQALVARGADPANVAIAGEDIGANLALHYALQDPDVQAIVMVSPGLDYQGIETEDEIVRLTDCPVLLLAAEEDVYAATSARTLKRGAPVFCELRSYPGSAHGTDLFATSPNALEQVIVWLDAVIATKK